MGMSPLSGDEIIGNVIPIESVPLKLHCRPIRISAHPRIKRRDPPGAPVLANHVSEAQGYER